MKEKKKLVLGEDPSTAQGKLRKKILFFLVQETGRDNCFQCGKKIETEDELSIEHKKAWLNDENGKELFWDLDNIAFSHLNCNVGARVTKTKHPSIRSYENGCRCDECKEIRKLKARKYRSKKKTMDNQLA